MKKLLFICLPALLLSCNSDDHGAKDSKNEMEKYPTYDTTSKMENINSSQDNEAAEPTNADPNHTTH